MESVADISSWLTPAIIIGLFLWLRADIRALEGRIDKRFDGIDKRLDGMDERLRAVETGQAEIRGQLTLMRDYILGRNLRQQEDAAEPAPGD
ncbi:MAG: hypothetical protein OXE86_09445 [Alphaproteobacteria bacterium]|nr:hypothetical protein [Alphaproteobacteria bacterium]